MGGRHAERLPIDSVEALRDVSGEFKMLRLIVAYRNHARLIKKNISRHQDGILQQARPDGLLLFGLGLKLGHALQPAERRDASQ